MNSTHGPSGAAVGLGALLGYTLLVGPVDPMTGTLWVVGCTAGALLPDSDHPSSNTARMWGPLTAIPCRALGKAAGGHRAGTHDVSKGSPLLFGIAFAVGLLYPPARLVTLALLVGMTVIGFAAFFPGKWETKAGPNLLVSWATAYGIDQYYPSGMPREVVIAVGAAIAVGVLTGIAGDACTVSGVPWRGQDVHLLPKAMRIHTGRWPEVICFRLPSLAGIVLFTYLLGQPMTVA